MRSRKRITFNNDRECFINIVMNVCIGSSSVVDRQIVIKYPKKKQKKNHQFNLKAAPLVCSTHSSRHLLSVHL